MDNWIQPGGPPFEEMLKDPWPKGVLIDTDNSIEIPPMGPIEVEPIEEFLDRVTAAMVNEYERTGFPGHERLPITLWKIDDQRYSLNYRPCWERILTACFITTTKLEGRDYIVLQPMFADWGAKVLIEYSPLNYNFEPAVKTLIESLGRLTKKEEL